MKESERESTASNKYKSSFQVLNYGLLCEGYPLIRKKMLTQIITDIQLFSFISSFILLMLKEIMFMYFGARFDLPSP